MDFENNTQVQHLAKELKKRSERLDMPIEYEEALEETIDALCEYYNDRHYSPTEDKPYEYEYSRIIIQLALSKISKRGAEGETSHTEGGVTRMYDNGSDYPLSLTRKIIPLAFSSRS